MCVVRWTVPDRPLFRYVFQSRKVECRDPAEAADVARDLLRDGCRDVRITGRWETPILSR